MQCLAPQQLVYSELHWLPYSFLLYRFRSVCHIPLSHAMYERTETQQKQMR